MARRDFYEVLGVAKSASPDEVKQAYRRLAREHHPDMNRDNPKAAEEKFKELSEAYEVLADPERRRRYDEAGFSAAESDFGPQGFTWQNFTHQGDLEDLLGSSPIFQQLFGNLLGNAQVFGGGGVMPGRHVEVAIRLPLKVVRTGAQSVLSVPHAAPCPDCKGTGARGGTAFETCAQCHGRGQVQQVLRQGRSQFVTVGVCPVCRGSGRRIRERCKTCKGRGQTESMRRIEVQIPAGVDNGTRLRLAGQGVASPNGGPTGDLYVRVEIEETPGFRREGPNLYSETVIPLATALLGGEVPVRTLAGEALVKIPAGTQPDREFRVKGEGVPRFGGGSPGDLFVTAHIEIPRALNSRQRELVEEALGGESAARRGSLFGRRN
ncbi:MAG: molecular chaperone DnaJ [Thermoplasmata archaeon]